MIQMKYPSRRACFLIFHIFCNTLAPWITKKFQNNFLQHFQQNGAERVKFTKFQTLSDASVQSLFDDTGNIP